jgi:hypothetical protein
MCKELEKVPKCVVSFFSVSSELQVSSLPASKVFFGGFLLVLSCLIRATGWANAPRLLVPRSSGKCLVVELPKRLSRRTFLLPPPRYAAGAINNALESPWKGECSCSIRYIAVRVLDMRSTGRHSAPLHGRKMASATISKLLTAWSSHVLFRSPLGLAEIAKRGSVCLSLLHCTQSCRWVVWLCTLWYQRAL